MKPCIENEKEATMKAVYRGVFAGIFCMMIPQLSLAYDEPDMGGLTVPSELSSQQFNLSITHRFYGKVDTVPFETIFGLDQSANVDLKLRYALRDRLELFTLYDIAQREFNIGASYAREFDPVFLNTQFNAQFYSINPRNGGERTGAFFLVSLQTLPIIDRIRVTADLGYDGYGDRFGLGTGLDVDVIGPFAIFGEYYPKLVVENDPLHSENSFDFGFRIATYGHLFSFFLGNNTLNETRNLMHGAADNGLRFGFTIYRLFGL